MDKTFIESILFQVNPTKLDEFESLIASIKDKQIEQSGTVNITYFKRFYTFDKTEFGTPPRKLTKIVKCVKYYMFWEFDTIESCGICNKWFFDNYSKEISRLLIAPFDINSGYTI